MEPHHPLAALGQLETADAAVVAAGDPLDQPGPLQAVGDLGHGAQRGAEFPADGRHRQRPAAEHAADPQLPQRQIPPPDRPARPLSCRINVSSRSATVLASSGKTLLWFIGFDPSGSRASGRAGRNHFIALYY